MALTTQINRTWVGGGTNDWFTAADWTTASPYSNASPIPGDNSLTFATGTMNLSGTAARALGQTGLFDFQSMRIGNASAASAPTLVLTNKAALGKHFTLATSGTAGYGTVRANGPSGLYGSIALGATAGNFTLDGTAGQLTLSHLGAVDVTGGQTLTLAGTVVDSGTITVGATSTLVNGSVLRVNGGTLTLAAGGILSGTGGIVLGLAANVTLRGDVPATQSIAFDGPDGKLTIDPARFHASIQGFLPGDLLDLAGITGATGATLAANGTLTVRNGTAVLATVANVGGTPGTLAVADDGAGGTQLSYAGTGTRLSYEIGAGAKALGADAVQRTLVAAAGTPTAGQAITGKGVKIGIISTGFDTKGDALANARAGYLPYNSGTDSVGVTVLADGNSGSSEEGQAMAQLIHAVAPDAQLYFYSGYTAGGLAAAVDALVAAGCNVITDDLGLQGVPFFQVPNAAQTAAADVAVQNALNAGVSYFTAAGNDTNAYINMNWTPGATTLRFQQSLGTVQAQSFFPNTGLAGYYEPILVYGNTTASLVLQWTAPWPTNADAPELLKLSLYDENATLISTSTQDRSGGFLIPQETLSLPQTTEDTQYRFAIYQKGSTAPSAFTVKLPGTVGGGSSAGGFFRDVRTGTGAGMLDGQKLIAGVNTVGASAAQDTPAFDSAGWQEAYSDGGPGKLYYAADGTALAQPVSAGKVSFTSVDSIATAASGFTLFDGTSAASPNAAAVAALMLQANPSLTNTQISGILASTATDLSLLPAQQGAGLIDAYRAVVAATAVATTAKAAPYDFDGDGRADILLQGDDGSVSVKLTSGLAVASTAALPSPGAGWHLIGSGDFDGDGKTDLLFQNTDGTLGTELLDGTALRTAGALANPGAAWHARGIADFNNDGRADVLMQNVDGSLQVVEAGPGGLSVLATVAVANPGAAWHAVGVGDFDGDGLQDGMFQNDDGTVGVILQGNLAAGVQVLGNPGAGATIAGTGDYNGDGKTDGLVRNADGTLLLGTVNGTTVTGVATLGSVGAAATTAMAGGDFNGDGKLDVLVQAADGTLAAATLDGTGNAAITSSAVLGQAGTGVRVIGNAPTLFLDGTAAGTLSGTPGTDAFLLATPAAGAHAVAGFDPVLDRVVLSAATFASYAAVQAAETASASGTTIALGGGASLLIQGLTPTQLGSSNFALV